MARVTKLKIICGVMLASAACAATAAQLSTPIIMSAETPPAKAPASEQKSPPPPAATTAYEPPASLSPQRQVQSRQAPPVATHEVMQPSVARPLERGGVSREAAPATSPSASQSPEVVRIEPKRLQLRRKREGTAIYRISITQPRAELTLFNGRCYAENKFEMRQQLLDMGLDTKKTSRLHPVYASLQTGRVAGCWYFDPAGKFFRVALENGQGEDFAKEQVDKIRR